MKVFFAGTPQNAAETLVALKKSGIEIVGVLTRTDAPIGRKRVLTPSPVALAAQGLNLPVIKSNSVTSEVLKQILTLGADLGVVVAYGAFLNRAALDALPKGWVNLHYSLLPQLRGAAPVQHALLQSLDSTGVSIFQLDEGMDTGPVYLEVPTQIEPGENAGRLLSRLTSIGVTALLEALPGIASGIAIAKPQENAAATFAPKISRDDAKIDWLQSATEIESQILAMNPEPMAWTIFDSNNLRILHARAVQGSDAQGLVPGCVFSRDDTVFVLCKDSALALLELQPAGKNPMAAIDWFRGQQSKGQIVLGS